MQIHITWGVVWSVIKSIFFFFMLFGTTMGLFHIDDYDTATFGALGLASVTSMVWLRLSKKFDL